MNKSLILSAVLLFISGHALAAKKDCNELKNEITAQLDKKGVKNYTLDIMDTGNSQETGGKVIGSCDGGTKKIVYRRK